MVDFVAGFGDKSATTWIRHLVAIDTVSNSVDFVADTVDCRRYGRLCHPNVERSFDFVASVYQV